jgi:hypothetical protein
MTVSELPSLTNELTVTIEPNRVVSKTVTSEPNVILDVTVIVDPNRITALDDKTELKFIVPAILKALPSR